MKVKATGKFKELGVWPGELNGCIPEAGFEFDVSSERYKVLRGNNKFNAVFVEAVEVKQPQEIETAVKEVKTEKAVKTKSTKKQTKKAK